MKREREGGGWREGERERKQLRVCRDWEEDNKERKGRKKYRNIKKGMKEMCPSIEMKKRVKRKRNNNRKRHK